MSAGKNAKAVGFKGWCHPVTGQSLSIEQAKESLPRYRCECGHTGIAGELLEDGDDNDTLYCPVCRTAAWVWE